MNGSASSKSDDIVRRLLDDPLELPDGTGFSAIPAQCSIKEIVAISERYLPLVNSHPEFVERKMRSVIDEPFAL
jgi:hypothetical protein